MIIPLAFLCSILVEIGFLTSCYSVVYGLLLSVIIQKKSGTEVLVPDVIEDIRNEYQGIIYAWFCLFLQV
jgi:hypothetical protein